MMILIPNTFPFPLPTQLKTTQHVIKKIASNWTYNETVLRNYANMF